MENINKRHKCGIITFHAAFNYGSMLQAYAMQTYLERSGHHVEIVNFRPENQKHGYPTPIDFTTIGNIKRSLKRLILTPNTIAPLNKKWHLFDEFLHKHLHLTKEFSTFEELKDANLDYDVLITGSDQIWNTSTFDFSEAYFGAFIKESTIKVAYAPSMGPNPETQNVNKVRQLLQGYNAVSVREERTRQFIVENDIFKNVEVVLDPTMLLEGSDYDALIDKKPLIEGEYLFYYTPGGIRHEFLGEAAKIGKKLGLPVICDSCYSPLDLRKYDNVFPYLPVGPSEFLNLIKNAKFVCGASFHLMVFSILFHKNFCCMNGDVDSRMNNLMKVCGCEKRNWSVVDKSKNTIMSDGNVDTERINLFRDKSINFLNNSLSIIESTR